MMAQRGSSPNNSDERAVHGSARRADPSLLRSVSGGLHSVFRSRRAGRRTCGARPRLARRCGYPPGTTPKPAIATSGSPQRSLSCISPTIWLASERLLRNGSVCPHHGYRPDPFGGCGRKRLVLLSYSVLSLRGQRPVCGGAQGARGRLCLQAEDRGGPSWRAHPVALAPPGRWAKRLPSARRRDARRSTATATLPSPTGRFPSRRSFSFCSVSSGSRRTAPIHEDVLADSRQRFEGIPVMALDPAST